MKYLFWLVLIVAGVFFYRKLTAQAQRARLQERTGTPPPGAQGRTQQTAGVRRTGRGQAEPKAITMVKCEHCHTHLAEDEALIRYGHVWCSEEHERLGPTRERT